MDERVQTLELGLELFREVAGVSEPLLFSPARGSITGRLAMLDVVLDFGQVDKLKTLPPDEIVANLPAFKGYIGSQLIHTRGIQAALAFYLGFDLHLTVTVHEHILSGLHEPLEAVQDALIEESKALNLDPAFFKPVFNSLGDDKISFEDFAKLVDDRVSALKYAFENRPSLRKIFIIMHYDATMEDTEITIKAAAKEAGFDAWRASELAFEGTRIHDVIFKGIEEAAHVVIDLTNSRPNVYFEAGYAHALRKFPVYIAKDGTPLAFDIQDYPVFWYKSNLRLLPELTSIFQRRSQAQSTAGAA